MDTIDNVSFIKYMESKGIKLSKTFLLWIKKCKWEEDHRTN